MNPAQKALWFIESHLAGRADARRDRRACGYFALPHGAGVRRRRPGFRSCATCVPDVSPRRRGRSQMARRISSRSRWTRITARTKHSPARSATASGSHPRWSAPRRASPSSGYRSPSSWIRQPPRQSSARRVSRPATRFLVAGISERYTCETSARPFPASGSAITSWSIAFPAGSARWLTVSAAMETTSATSITSPASRCPTFPTCRARSVGIRIPAQKYAVFTDSDHVSGIRRTVNTIWNHWLPASGLQAADAPNFERYDEKFDPLTGNGGLKNGFRSGSSRRAVQRRGDVKSSTSRRRWHLTKTTT